MRAAGGKQVKHVDKSMSERLRSMTFVPYILSSDCKNHLSWLTSVFDAQVGKDMVLSEDSKKVMHCVVDIGGNELYISDRYKPSYEGAENEKPFGFICHFNMTREEDAKAVWKKALDNGAKVAEDLQLQNWGAVYGILIDPFGYSWGIHVCVGNAPKPST
eukprot:Em0013g171a